MKRVYRSRVLQVVQHVLVAVLVASSAELALAEITAARGSTHKAVPERAAKAIIPVAARPEALPRTDAIAADQIWLISTRRLGCPSTCSHEDPNLQVWQCIGGRWEPSNVELFLASDDPATPTSYFIHGHGTTADEARSIGLAAYRQLAKCSGGMPLRFVIWSWPSEPGHGLLRDLRMKAERANAEGYYVAWLIDRMDPSVRVTLLGYSYGARVATATLHALGGGRVAGRSLDYRVHPQRAPLNAVLMASAIDNDWLAPGHTHGQAVTQVDHLLLVNNPCDRVLRRYRFIAPYRPEALGYTGLPRYASLAPYWSNIREISVCDADHEWSTYFYSSRIVAAMQPLVFGETLRVSGNAKIAVSAAAN